MRGRSSHRHRQHSCLSMIALVFLAGVAAALADPFTVLPIYENPADLVPSALEEARSACIDNCHHHILEKPVFIMIRSVDDKFIVNYVPQGLNSMPKSPLTAPLHQTLMAGRKIAVLFPFEKFPMELFPGVKNIPYDVPEHRALFSEVPKIAPIMAIFSEEEFAKLNLAKSVSMIAEMTVSPAGYGLVKDYALTNRAVLPRTPLALAKSSPVSPLVYLITPQSYPTTAPTYSYIAPELGRTVVIPQPQIQGDIPAYIPKRNIQAHLIPL